MYFLFTRINFCQQVIYVILVIVLIERPWLVKWIQSECELERTIYMHPLSSIIDKSYRIGYTRIRLLSCTYIPVETVFHKYIHLNLKASIVLGNRPKKYHYRFLFPTRHPITILLSAVVCVVGLVPKK